MNKVELIQSSLFQIRIGNYDGAINYLSLIKGKKARLFAKKAIQSLKMDDAVIARSIIGRIAAE